MSVGPSPWTRDLTVLRERLAEQLAIEGARHPDVAAAALAARGRRGLTRTEWARLVGLGDADVEAAETGRLDWSAVPAPLRRSIDAALAQNGTTVASRPVPGPRPDRIRHSSTASISWVSSGSPSPPR